MTADAGKHHKDNSRKVIPREWGLSPIRPSGAGVVPGPFECLPCLSRQLAMTAQLSDAGKQKRHAGIAEALMHLAMSEPDTPLPVVSEDLQRTVMRHTGGADSYADVRRRLSSAARALLPALLRLQQEARDPWPVAVRVSAAGNLMEQARDPEQAGAAMDAAWHAAVRGRLALDHGEELRQAAKDARRIVFLADNAGEVIWDSLLIDQLGASRVTLAARRLPYLHDALAEELVSPDDRMACEVAAFDDPPPGYAREHGTGSLDQLLAGADLVIAKGSEWPERLAGRVPAELCFFLFAPACHRIATRFGVPPKSLVAAHAAALTTLR
ncbi:ARMT1-like domain-containing protein [Termitidicoccus mucosus]|uniref:Damage-control phosphatase ARMT1-like metal-binding domain-containing protein n=1 Tax=Termitidicoccus mucosus TaxID=1184151 RepID=A0A178IIF2_9BACT|nr:hypothetical protein AW736_09270 [Opitutaceae bacterium TSB47]